MNTTASTTPTVSLTVSKLTKVYTGASGPLPILNGVDLTLSDGDALAITGPSGSGKSTLLYIIGLLDEPSSGSLQIHDTNPFELNKSQQAEFRNRSIGFVFQDHHLLPQCTVLENVLIPTLAGNPVEGDTEARGRELLGRVGLGERLMHRPAQLSGGERQRVAVCRSLINRPSLLLADEPTGNLDRKTSEDVGTLLLEVASEQRATLICVTHSESLAGRFPRHQQLRDGRLVDADR